MSIFIGEVTAVNGIQITLTVDETSNKDTIFYEGQRYKGISIREYVAIQRGFRDIVCIVEGEYLDETRFQENTDRIEYVRKVHVRPIGYIENGKFFEGIKFLPLIRDPAFLLPEQTLKTVYSSSAESDFCIGLLLKEGIEISLPWQKLFNTHIGIFGNTGSGKSNTLTKLFTTLFDEKHEQIKPVSKFVLLDFNGEYTKDQIVSSSEKNVIDLNTDKAKHQFPLADHEFWNAETLSILFQATPNTQKPFISSVLRGREKYKDSPNSLLRYIKETIRFCFVSTSQKPETLDLLKRVVGAINGQGVLTRLENIIWHSKQNKFKYEPMHNAFFDTQERYTEILEPYVSNITLDELSPFAEFTLRCELKLIWDVMYGSVQFEHIQPLLKRAESSLNGLSKVIKVKPSDEEDGDEDQALTVISLRNCNQDVKKIIPLLVTKHYYNSHKKQVKESPPEKTLHLIIDEAHNILSQQSVREQANWKDYRLELFEELIKEGRKFGIFLTLSSQRPADISATIMSQLHNFFIHRLVNDRDLFLLDNTISTLDSVSRSLIPNLAKGSCIITGTSFDLPMLIQVDELSDISKPDSNDVLLDNLWAVKTEEEPTWPLN
ncbi:ATP-binding protein [Vibrio alginolyticus]|uniref:ATP-binding protein n=1 Tax=Vibrio TaxID=662 RepID=UPI001C9C58D0|nr:MULTISPECIES: ATP-binding protein [Vibrio]ELI1834965.1 ATP-binding protein [Vibrio alginolyticus]MBY7683900.1 ATP-binding protein [Vibrio alginolyticus]MCA2484612.1 ATP-binding protein [Vibrio alginolyticus]MDA0096424.1 ATP-binding protein [Vibrio sp. ART SEL2]MDW2280918.1 ATP-binding protein [Vibrio sp. 1402]